MLFQNMFIWYFASENAYCAGVDIFVNIMVCSFIGGGSVPTMRCNISYVLFIAQIIT